MNPDNPAGFAWVRESDVEDRFWSIVDADGLMGLPSDMWEALDRLVAAYRQRSGRPADPRIPTRMRSDSGSADSFYDASCDERALKEDF